MYKYLLARAQPVREVLLRGKTCLSFFGNCCAAVFTVTATQPSVPCATGEMKPLRSRALSLHRPNHFPEFQALVGGTCAKNATNLATDDKCNVDPATILMNPQFNKGTAFSTSERETLHLRGLLPACIETIETQVKRCYAQFNRFQLPMSKYIYLSSLKERNETLFYHLLVQNLEEVMPYIYTPTVGQACQEFGLQFRQAEGMYFSQQDRGHIRRLMDNWKPHLKSGVAIIVVTDGSRILGLGDLGACGMGIPVGKLSLYVAAGGFHPATTLPVVLDAGTDNKELLEDEFYLGQRHPRLPDAQFYPLVEEFMAAVKDKWPNALVQFEDFSNNHCFELLDTYRNKQLCFNDDIQGTGAVIAAGFLNAIRLAKVPVAECRIVFFGAGAAGIGVADQIARALQHRYGLTMDECRALFYMVDSKGLVTTHRGDVLQPFKVPYARTDVTESIKDLNEVVAKVRPVALIGLSGQPGAFSPELLHLMGEINLSPIIFPLSNPTVKAECTFQQAYDATAGRVIFASGSPFPSIIDPSTAILRKPSQGNNLYTFPGLGYGAWLCQATSVTDEMITTATIALADCTTDEQLSLGSLYPPLDQVRDVSAVIAAQVIECAQKQGIARRSDIPEDRVAFVKQSRYEPAYLDLKD